MKVILSHFGNFHSGSGNLHRSDLEATLSEFLGEATKIDFQEAKRLASKIWYEGGKIHERKQLFRIFDKKDKGMTTLEEMRAILTSKLEVPVTDDRFQEMMEYLKVDWRTPISFLDFGKLENQID